MSSAAAARKRIRFDSKTFFATTNRGRKIAAFTGGQTIFAQGERSNAVFYIRQGKVKLNVVSKAGKEATVAILNKADFFKEGCLTGQSRRLCSASAMADCSVMPIEKKSTAKVLHQEPEVADLDHDRTEGIGTS